MTDRRPPAVPRRRRRALRRDLRRGGLPLVLRKAAGNLRRGWQLRRYRFNLRYLTASIDSVRLDRPLFVLGVQGGGLTVLARCLYRHPQTVYASGNSSWWAGPDEIHNCPHIHDLPEPLVHRSYHFQNVTDAVTHHPRFGYQRSWLYAVDELLPTYRKTAEDADPETQRQFLRVLRKLVLTYAHDPARGRFVDMSQLYTVQVPYLARMLKDCDPRFVVAARNPYATCARAVVKEYADDRGAQLQDEESRIACAVEHWSNSFRLALEDTHELPVLVVRYEDFMDRPDSEVRRICEFAGLEFDPRQMPAPGQPFPLGSLEDDKWYPLRGGENEAWLRRLDPRLVRALNERAGDLIERLGYERIEA